MINEATAIAVPCVVAVIFIALTVRRYLKGSAPLGMDDFDPDLVARVIMTLFAVVLALFVIFPPGRHFLLPHLTPLSLWLSAVICGLVCLGCWLLTERILGYASGCVALISFLLLLPLAIDAGGIALVRWSIDIGLRINDWQLMTSPLAWFVVAFILVVTIIDTDDWRTNFEDNSFLFKLAALAGSLICLVFILDMDLHHPPIVEDLWFRPPLAWFTLAGSALGVAFAWRLGTTTDKEDSTNAKQSKAIAALIGGFFLPGALNALLLIPYFYFGK